MPPPATVPILGSQERCLQPLLPSPSLLQPCFPSHSVGTKAAHAGLPRGRCSGPPPGLGLCACAPSSVLGTLSLPFTPPAVSCCLQAVFPLLCQLLILPVYLPYIGVPWTGLHGHCTFTPAARSPSARTPDISNLSLPTLAGLTQSGPEPSRYSHGSLMLPLMPSWARSCRFYLRSMFWTPLLFAAPICAPPV